MTFPVSFDLFGHRVLAHTVLEVIAYATGARLYWHARRGARTPLLPAEQNLWVLTGAIVGAAVGSKVLAWAESPLDYWSVRATPAAWLGGKTIVGGLLGGWIGVEVAKRRLAVTRRTGDAFVFPLLLGIAIGRVGCFLTGLPDHTYGLPSSLPWAVNFGDGVPRHPTQLYEILFLLLLGLVLLPLRRGSNDGRLFRVFVAAYLAWRFFIDFLKPRFDCYAGLSAIQWASLAGAAVCLWQWRRIPAVKGANHDRTTRPIQPRPAAPAAGTLAS